jgi:hypothetical protein
MRQQPEDFETLGLVSALANRLHHSCSLLIKAVCEGTGGGEACGVMEPVLAPTLS